MAGKLARMPTSVVWRGVTASRKQTWQRLFTALALGVVAGFPAGARAQPPEQVRVGESSYSLKPNADALGAISVGHPFAGYLVNGVRMPEGDAWSVGVPQHAYGTEETVASLVYCIRKVSNDFPGTPKVKLGSLSPKGGGAAPPHKSHRTGRDVDIYLYRLPGFEDRWNKSAKAEDLDRARTWALMRCFITDTDIDFILLDRTVQAWVREYALSIGEDPDWLSDLFEGDEKRYSSLIKHIPGHTAHMHVRFVSAAARKRGLLAYDRLVEQGHIPLPVRELTHRVARGDTLIGLAHKYKTNVKKLKRLNRLRTSLIKVGQVLKLQKRQDIRGARDPVIVPPRRLPPEGTGVLKRAGQTPSPHHRTSDSSGARGNKPSQRSST